jgi:hypothetical protein
MKAELALLSLDVLCIIIWFLRLRVYDVLELSSIIDKTMYNQLLPLIFILTISAGSLLTLRASRKAQPAIPPPSVDKPSQNPADSTLAESIKEIQQKLADLHAMGTLRKKKDGADH